MKKIEIWMEGFIATGQSQGAHKIWEGEAIDFDSAVTQYMIEEPTVKVEINTRNRYISDEAYHNRRSNYNIWACNLFDNATEARKSFG